MLLSTTHLTVLFCISIIRHSLYQSLLALVVSRLLRRPVHKILVKTCICLVTKQNIPVAISAVSAIVNCLYFGSDKQRICTYGRSWSIVKLNLIIYFNCACTKLIQTHKGRNRPGATIPRSCERGVMRTGYPTPSRQCKYCSMVCSAGMIQFSSSSKHSIANSAQHFCPL
jgi:hypothetical protein